MRAAIVVGVLVVVGVAHAQQAPAVDVAKQRDWSRAMHQTALPKKGCFEAAYPATAWREVPCKKPPNILMVPRKHPRPFTIGNANDVSAQAPSGTISFAVGSFDSVTGVTSESSPIGNSGTPVTNAYTLQVNTNPFTSTACSGSPNTACQGWEQFVFYNSGSGASLFIQYWLLRYNTTCPAGWQQFQFTGSTDIYCVRNAAGSASPPNQPISNLANLTLSGTANASGDSVSFSTGTNMYAATGDNLVAASSGWQFAEFNVFGAGGNSSGGGAATFNSGSSIQPRVRIVYGGTAAPLCSPQGFTGETNNLSFGPGAPTVTAAGPALFFTESTAGGASSNCAAASSIGDTHLTTVKGLFYDYQASGDFVLAETGQDFTVQVRQVSGAPSWPNAAVNHAVAARLGRTSVAVCLGGGEQGPRIFVDGKPVELGEEPRSVSEDVDAGRIGSSVVFTSETGNSLRAEINPTWINVYLGFAHPAGDVRGLIANANDNANQIAARDGSVLTAAFPFDDLYQRFGESWRVSSKDSLLAPCGAGEPGGRPSQTFYAGDLPPDVRAKAQGTCRAAGVTTGPLFDACTIDVAVLGTDKAATVFATLPPPAAVGQITRTGGSGSGSGSGSAGSGGTGGGGGPPGGVPWWVWLLILFLLLVVVVWIVTRRKKSP